MDLEIQRVAREMFKAFSGMNAGFEDVSLRFDCYNVIHTVQAKDQIVIDELSSHTDTGRQELIHPYKVRRI